MTDIVNSSTFQQRMFERIRESMGDLLSDDDLKEILHRTVEETFFKDRVIPGAYYNSKPTIEPSEFKALVSEAVQPQVKEVVTQWVNEHQDEITTIIDGVIKERILNTCIRAFDDRLAGAMAPLQSQLYEALKPR